MKRTRERGVTLIEMLVVVAILGVMTGLTYPSISAGLDSLRLSTACDDIGALFNTAANFSERRQQAVEIRITPHRIEALSSGFEKHLDLDKGTTIEGDPRFFFIEPAGPLPGITLDVHNTRGARKTVRIDPISGAIDTRNSEVRNEEKK